MDTAFYRDASLAVVLGQPHGSSGANSGGGGGSASAPPARLVALQLGALKFVSVPVQPQQPPSAAGVLRVGAPRPLNCPARILTWSARRCAKMPSAADIRVWRTWLRSSPLTKRHGLCLVVHHFLASPGFRL